MNPTSIVFRILGFFGKLLKKFLVYTGLWITLLGTIGSMIVIELFAHLIGRNADTPVFNAIFTVCMIVSFIPALYIFSQNIIRIVKKDFAWSEVIANRKGSDIGFLSKEKGVAANDVHGIVFGKKGNKYITQTEETDGHTMVVGGAGSGKTTGVIIPTLQSWQGRTLFIDIKPELYDASIKARGEDNVKVFDPTDRYAYGYDPLYMLRNSDNPSQDAHMIADILIPVPVGSNADPVWAKGAQSIFVAAALYYINDDPGISFAELIKKIRLQAPADLIDMIAESDNELAKMEITDKIGADAKTIASFSSELQSLAIFASDTQLVSALDNSRYVITPDTINDYDVCLRIREEKLNVWAKLLNLIVSQFLASFERRPNNNNLSTLVCIDECPRLGKIGSLEHGLATLRSKGIKMLLVCQSKSQFDNIYGKDETKSIFDNCSRKVILRSTEPETQKYLSDMVGTYDKKTKSRNANTNAYGMASGSGVSYSEQEKRIIKPEEFAYLGDDLIYLSPNGYDRLTKIKCWQDAPFMDYMPD